MTIFLDVFEKKNFFCTWVSGIFLDWPSVRRRRRRGRGGRLGQIQKFAEKNVRKICGQKLANICTSVKTITSSYQLVTWNLQLPSINVFFVMLLFLKHSMDFESTKRVLGSIDHWFVSMYPNEKQLLMVPNSVVWVQKRQTLYIKQTRCYRFHGIMLHDSSTVTMHIDSIDA